MRLHSDKQASEKRESRQRSRRGEAVAQPSKAAKLSGTPNKRIVTCPAVGGHTLRANRYANERRECARCARERLTSVVGGEAAAGGERLISMCWCRTSCWQARQCTLRLQSCQSSGAEPTWSGCNSTLT